MTQDQINRLVDLINHHCRVIEFENNVFGHKVAELLRKPDAAEVTVEAKPVE